jgi:5,10-methylenetetrahydrofolate reductase
VFVGAPSQQSTNQGLKLQEAYGMAKALAPGLFLGGIAIAERHARRFDEHERILSKVAQGCRFFITQAIYDATSTKSLLSDYAIALEKSGQAPIPLILTFSPCGSPKTLEFMKWLGISFPRWLENDLRNSTDQLEKSVALCESIFVDVLDYAREKHIPVGINVESVSIRKPEIDASVALFHALRRKFGSFVPG